MRRRGSRGDLDWRDPLTWVAIGLLVAIGFGGAYGLWWRTWQLDMARELDFYVNVSQVKLRDFQTQTDVFFAKRDAASLGALALSAARLEGTLVQIPRRGPVEWRAEIVGLAETIETRLSSALAAQLARKDDDALATLAEPLPALRDRLRDLDAAMENTVLHAGQNPRRTNWTPEVTAALLAALEAAREQADRLPE
jgi:hypothetical protein